MAHRVNIMLDDEVWRDMRKVPRGDRSRFVNRAIRDLLLRGRRQQAIKEMDALRGSTAPVPGSTEAWVREDRDSHR